MDKISRPDVEDLFSLITAKHGLAGTNWMFSMRRSIGRTPFVDNDNLCNPVELWPAAGGHFNKMRWRRI